MTLTMFRKNENTTKVQDSSSTSENSWLSSKCAQRSGSNMFAECDCTPTRAVLFHTIFITWRTVHVALLSQWEWKFLGERIPPPDFRAATLLRVALLVMLLGKSASSLNRVPPRWCRCIALDLRIPGFTCMVSVNPLPACGGNRGRVTWMYLVHHRRKWRICDKTVEEVGLSEQRKEEYKVHGDSPTHKSHRRNWATLSIHT